LLKKRGLDHTEIIKIEMAQTPITSRAFLFLWLLGMICAPQGASGLKCFSCHYDTDLGHNSEAGKDNDPNVQCHRKSPSIQLLSTCEGARKGKMVVCVNSSLVEDGQLVAVTRGCQEVGCKSPLGCTVDAENFTTCLCETDGCNVEELDMTNNAPVLDDGKTKKKAPENDKEGSKVSNPCLESWSLEKQTNKEEEGGKGGETTTQKTTTQKTTTQTQKNGTGGTGGQKVLFVSSSTLWLIVCSLILIL